MRLRAVERQIERVERQWITEEHAVDPAVGRIGEVAQRLDERPLAIHRLVELLGGEGSGPVDRAGPQLLDDFPGFAEPVSIRWPHLHPVRHKAVKLGSASTSGTTSTPLIRTSLISPSMSTSIRATARITTLPNQTFRKRESRRSTSRGRWSPGGPWIGSLSSW